MIPDNYRIRHQRRVSALAVDNAFLERAAGSAGVRGHCSASRPVPASGSDCWSTGCNRAAGRLRTEIRAGRRLWLGIGAHLRPVGVGAGARCVCDPQFREWGWKNRVRAVGQAEKKMELDTSSG